MGCDNSSADAVAADAAARIAAAVRAWRVVLFGSRARGTARPHSDYDFYVEVDADASSLPELQHGAWTAVHGTGPLFDVKVMQRGALERRRDDPGTIEWDVAREGIVLFAAPGAPTSIAPATRVRERPLPTPQSVAEWVHAAERDERHARDLWQLGRDYWPEICWLSQQMCEKFMKALLVSRFMRPERTHDLTVLLIAARTNGIDLGALDPECELLTEHAITPRYVVSGFTEQNACDASAAAQRITAAVRSLLP